jgi:hypothetical protein
MQKYTICPRTGFFQRNAGANPKKPDTMPASSRPAANAYRENAYREKPRIFVCGGPAYPESPKRKTPRLWEVSL